MFVVLYGEIHGKEKGVWVGMGCFSCAFGLYFCFQSSYKKNFLKTFLESC